MDISKFKNTLNGGVKSNLYKVELTFPSISGMPTGVEEKLEFLCKGTSIPQSTLSVIEIPYAGRIIPLPNDRTFDEWSITVYNDPKLDLRTAFEMWSAAFNGHESNVNSMEVADLMVVAKVHQLNRAGTVLKSWEFQDVWPVTVSNIDLSYDSSDSLEEFTVSLRYTLWKSDKTN
jgi:hypothetical protein